MFSIWKSTKYCVAKKKKKKILKLFERKFSLFYQTGFLIFNTYKTHTFLLLNSTKIVHRVYFNKQQVTW